MRRNVEGNLPTGTVSFLYTDIEGSSRLHERFPDAMAAWHEAHDGHLEGAIAAACGHRYRFTGDGFCAAFATPEAALSAAMNAQRALSAQPWEGSAPRVRMAVFAGPVERRGGEYVGRTLSRGSRLLGAAHGGQTLLNRAAVELLPNRTFPGVDLRELGAYVLHGVGHRETIFQAVPEGFAADFPPLVRHRGAIPDRDPPEIGLGDSEARPFFGRKREVRELRRLLTSEGGELVTISGLGGMGKSRLAREVAREIAPAFPDGVHFVRCETVQSREELVAAIADAFGLSAPQSNPEQALNAALQGLSALVVLDGFEGLTDHGPRVEAAIASAPGVRALVTSRWPLGLTREREYPLGSLGCTEGLTGAATRLFINAATYANAQFRATPKNLATISRICERLEGMPLALLIAAGCLKWCSLSALERTVGGQLLDVGGHSSLRNVIDASVGAIDESDREFLIRLVTFRGSFGIEDVAQVLDVSPSVALGRLDRLLDYSLVQSIHDESPP